MGRISKKEILAILQLTTAGLCLLAVCLMASTTYFLDDLWMFMYQCALTTTMVLCLLFGCSIWYYNSNYSRTRYHVRIFICCVLWVICAFGFILAAPFFFLSFTGRLFGNFETAIYDTMDFFMLLIGMGAGCCANVLLLVTCVFLTLNVLKKKRKRKNRNK